MDLEFLRLSRSGHRFSPNRTTTGRWSTSRSRSPGMTSKLSHSPYSQYYSPSPSQSYKEEPQFFQLPPEDSFNLERENKRSRLSFGTKRSGLQTPPPLPLNLLGYLLPCHGSFRSMANTRRLPTSTRRMTKCRGAAVDVCTLHLSSLLSSPEYASQPDLLHGYWTPMVSLPPLPRTWCLMRSAKDQTQGWPLVPRPI